MDIFIHKSSHRTGKHLRTAAVISLGLISSMTSSALLSSDRLYQHRDANGVVTFSDAPMVNGQVIRQSYTNFTRQPTIANPCKGLSTAQLDAKGNNLNDDLNQAAATHSLDVALIKAVARAESCFDPSAVSRAGAQGLMQLMPATARAMGVSDSFDLQQNLHGGAKYLAAMLARYNDNTDLALAAYNAGPGNVDKYNGVPPFPETRTYIASVNKFWQRYTAQPNQVEPVASNR